MEGPARRDIIGIKGDGLATGDDWRLAIGDWRLATGDWRDLALYG